MSRRALVAAVLAAGSAIGGCAGEAPQVQGAELLAVDVRRRIEGRDAIREWAAREVIGGSLRVDTVTALGPDAQRVRVHWAPSGSAGWAADYTFRVGGGEIVEADLQYAR
jgi:hypothetical protein